ncbi:hypothetical protein [Streptomyces lushanensis]|uniref:hypothetical protein n=1 Tax=Streptomyces lushanensis TaxID=1434255 RepID=UPI00082E9EF3|nr:hypothetical protein [Streptomyces lushanensis]
MTSTERPENSTNRPRRRRSPLVAAVAAAVLIAGGGGAYFATSAFGGSGADDTGGGSGTPGGDRIPPPVAGTPPPLGIAPGEPDPRGFTYRAKGELPDGPRTARVHRVDGAVTANEVARLAEALGVAGTPRSDGMYWKAGTDKDGSGPLLRVTKQAPGTWTFDRFGPAGAGSDNCLKGKSCPSVGGTGAGAGGAVSEAAAKRAAAPVLKALGQGDADLDATQLMGAVRVVNADPVVGGLPTYGWSTSVQIGADGHVVNGVGQLTAPEPGRTYPVIAAAEALKELNKASADLGGGGPAADCATAMPLEDGKAADRCEPPVPAGAKPVEIDGAVFGLALRTLEGGGALVPAWLFEVAPGGGAPSQTLVQLATAPESLARSEPPSAPEPEQSDPGLMSYRVDGQTLALRFMGGVCGTYTAHADESGTAVKVRISHSDSGPDQVCVAMARTQTAKVTLERPLDGRRVVDAETGKRVPLG